MTPELQIGFLPFYVDYYEGICADFPREKAEVARRCAQQLGAYGEVLWDGALIGDVETAASAARGLAKQKPECVVVVTTIAVFGGIVWAALREIDAPILLWNAQGIETVNDGYSMEEIVRNTGQIGTQAIANTLVREGRTFRVVTGYENGDAACGALERFFRVQGAVQAVRKARLLAVGEPFPLMTDIELDDDYLARHVGASVARVDATTLTDVYESSPESALKKECEKLQLAGNISDIQEDELSRSLRLSQALNTLVERHGACGGTLNCHGTNCLRNPKIGVTACYALGVQNSAGRPFTCTGDVPTALAMLLLKSLTGAAMYTEVQVMDEVRQAIVIANSGEGEDAVRREGSAPLVRGNTNFNGLHGRGASFAYPLQPGSATVASLTPTPKGAKPFCLIVAEGEILDEPLPDAGALAGFFRFAHTNLHDGYTRWLEAGAVHHAGTTLDHCGDELSAVCEQLNFEIVRI